MGKIRLGYKKQIKIYQGDSINCSIEDAYLYDLDNYGYCFESDLHGSSYLEWKNMNLGRYWNSGSGFWSLDKWEK